MRLERCPICDFFGPEPPAWVKDRVDKKHEGICETCAIQIYDTILEDQFMDDIMYMIEKEKPKKECHWVRVTGEARPKNCHAGSTEGCTCCDQCCTCGG